MPQGGVEHAPGPVDGGVLRTQPPSELTAPLLSEPDPVRCAHRILAGFCERNGASGAVCMVVDGNGECLRGLAGHGVDPTEVERFSIGLDESHGLVVALGEYEPMIFGGSDRGRLLDPPVPLGEGAVHVVPLNRPETESALGLLLYLGDGHQVTELALQAADVLALRLLCLDYRQVRAERERLANERGMLRRILDAVTDPVLAVDGEGRTVHANARAERLFSAGEEESEGRRRAVALNNMLFSAACFTRSEEHESHPVHRELPLADPSEGRDLLFELLRAPFPEAGGFATVLRDVTDLRRATEEMDDHYVRLRQAEARMRAERDRLDLIIQSVADPILVTDPNGEIELMNPPAERLFTVPPKAGRQPRQRVATNDAVFSSFVSNVYTVERGQWTSELQFVDPRNGAIIPMAATAGKVVMHSGELRAVVTILHDRTEAVENARLYAQLKHHSEELEEKVREATAELLERNELLQRQAVELEQASRLKSQFLANVSHELRTPLHAILGYTQLLLEEAMGELNERQRSRLARVDSNAQNLLAIINDILDIARVEAGRLPVDTEDFRLGALLEEVLAEMEPLVARSEVAVHRRLDAALPLLHTDRQKLKQVLMNLLSNALKFTEAGWVAIEAEHDPDADAMTIDVADTGIGIAPQDQQVIFQDFRQADDSTTRRYGGTGLGLSICRRLTTALGGELTVHSQVGAGSRFTLRVPRRLQITEDEA